MRLGRGRAEQPGPNDDPADTMVPSELGWVRVDCDTRLWIPCPLILPDGYDRDWWATAAAAAWWEQSGLVYQDDVIGKLATMLRMIREGGYGRVRCHQIWIYLRDPGIPPHPVFIGIWKQAGDRDRRLRLLTCADDKSSARKPQVSEVTTEHLGTGLCVLNHRVRDKGRLQALLSYAFRVEEHETDLQVFTSSLDLRALTAANDDIERLVQGITVYRNTDERRVAEP
jgi:hypothetical protein